MVDADIQSYFDTIPHDRLMEQVRLKVADGKALSLIEDYLAQEVMLLMLMTACCGAPTIVSCRCRSAVLPLSGICAVAITTVTAISPHVRKKRG